MIPTYISYMPVQQILSSHRIFTYSLKNILSWWRPLWMRLHMRGPHFHIPCRNLTHILFFDIYTGWWVLGNSWSYFTTCVRCIYGYTTETSAVANENFVKITTYPFQCTHFSWNLQIFSIHSRNAVITQSNIPWYPIQCCKDPGIRPRHSSQESYWLSIVRIFKKNDCIIMAYTGELLYRHIFPVLDFEHIQIGTIWTQEKAFYNIIIATS